MSELTFPPNARRNLRADVLVPTTGSDEYASAYGPAFWFAYLANTTLMIAVSILFRYADFVSYLGGSEMQLGLITGTGMIGAVLIRVFQGVGIDRSGPRQIWLYSLVLLVIALVAHLGITRLGSPAIYLLRITIASSVAGALGASITYVSLRVPAHRMAEMIGVLGTSGFIGISVGPIVGDSLFHVPRVERSHIDQMFLAAAAMASLSLIFATLATRHQTWQRGRRPPSVVYLIRRYHPGALLLVGVAMGFGLGLPHTFLRPYTATLGVERMKVFFLVYAAVALVVRVLTRRLSERLGVKPVIQMGLGCLAATMLSYLVVQREWMLAIPAAIGGTAHALLFPAVVAGSNVSFPRRYRGLATALIMAMFDTGILVGQPTVGALIDVSKRVGLPPYTTMFITVAFGLAGVSLVYAVSSADKKRLRTARGPSGFAVTGPTDDNNQPTGAGPPPGRSEVRSSELRGHA